MRRRHVFTRLTWYHPLDWYFRIRGYGLSVQPARSCKRLFSERNGYRRAWHVAGLCIKPLGGRLERTRKARAQRPVRIPR